MDKGWWLLVALSVAACRPAAAPGTPQEAWRLFVTRLQRADVEGAWSMLSPKTRELVTLRSQAISAASGGQVRDEPHALLFAAGRPGAVGEVREVSKSDDAAVLQVKGADGERTVKLVKADGRWLVDLSEQLEPKTQP